MDNKESKVMGRIFIGTFIFIFLALTIFVLITLFEPFSKKKISQLPDTTIEECLKEAAGSSKKYYVLIYDPDDVDNEFINDVVINYYKAMKKDSSLNRIYVMDYSKEDATKVSELLEEVTSSDSLPFMFIVSNGSVSTKYNTSSKINNALVAAMTK